MDGVTIRQARVGDGQALAELHLDTAATLHELDPSRFRMPDTEGMADWIDRDLATMGDEWICLVAEENQRIVGQVEAKVHPPIESARFQVMTDLGSLRGEVNSLGVLSGHRRRGIGASLMSEVERWLRDQGVRVIVLDTYLASPESVPFYDAIGYRRASIIFERRL